MRPPRISCRVARVHGHRRARSTCATCRSGGPGRPAHRGDIPEGPGSAIDDRGSSTRSCTSPTRTPRPTPRGPARRCRPKPNGSSPHAVASTGRRSRGATNHDPAGGSWPTSGTVTSRGATPSPTASPARHRSGRSRPTGMACTTWPATCGSGPPTGTRPATADDADKPCCVPHNPTGGTPRGQRRPGQPQFPVPRRVIKGGSHLCADNYCLRYRPAARRPQMIDTGMSHIGFRCVRRQADRAGANVTNQLDQAEGT